MPVRTRGGGGSIVNNGNTFFPFETCTYIVSDHIQCIFYFFDVSLSLIDRVNSDYRNLIRDEIRDN